MTGAFDPTDQRPRSGPLSDQHLPENSQENLDRKLDHAVKETFPTSDPVSVTITKGGAIDYDDDGNPISAPSDSTMRAAKREAEALLNRVKSTASDVADKASTAAREAYRQSTHYARAAGEWYPEAERYYREGTQVVRQHAAEYPLLTLVVGFGIGYLLARAIQSSGSDQAEGVPEYARTDRAFARY